METKILDIEKKGIPILKSVEEMEIPILKSIEEMGIPILKSVEEKGVSLILEFLKEKGLKIEKNEIKDIKYTEVRKRERGRHRGEIPENFDALLLRYQTEKYFTLDAFVKNAILKDGTTLKRSTLCNYIKEARSPKKEKTPKERTYLITITTSEKVDLCPNFNHQQIKL